jgi:acetyl esterase/lipase
MRNIRQLGDENSRVFTTALLFVGFIIVVFFCKNANANQETALPGGKAKTLKEHPDYHHVTTGDAVRSVVDHPAFGGFGDYLLPWDNRTQQLDTLLINVRYLLPYHSHVKPDVVVAAINYMIDEVNAGHTIFYDFYTDRQKRLDPAKQSAGLFFFRGNPGAPFAVICPGGGFVYVGSLHEGFPHAVELSKKGFNVFVLRYRVGDGLKASEDLAAAISYIVRNADMLEVGTEGYSLWGSSAGARMVGDIALNGVTHYGGLDIPKPGVVVIAYTGHSIYSSGFPPTFITVSEDDPIANASGVDRRVNNLKRAGVRVEYHRFKHAGHGFGTGVGTDAEGWIDSAAQFWQDNLPH